MSDISVIAASAAPNTMNAPSTGIQDFTLIRIQWSPAYANSDPVNAYEIKILAADGLTYQ